MKLHKLMAKAISYDKTERKLQNVKYIVIHYTGNKGDTARANANYFAKTNTRAAGAHFFVDKAGEVWRSIPMKKIAWAVGGFFTTKNEAGAYYKKCINANSVSIELCDCIKETSWEQMKATRELVLYIKSMCPNAKTIIRHWDVNGKECPAPFIGKNNEAWKHFKNYLENGYQFTGTLIKDTPARSSARVTPLNKLGTLPKGMKVNVIKVSNNKKWALLTKRTEKGRAIWIATKRIK